MFAIFADGGRQYKVGPGDRLVIDYRKDLQPGDAVKFEQILLASSGGEQKVGTPMIEGATIEAQVLGHRKGLKLEIQRYKRRKKMRRHNGHRQKHTAIQIGAVAVPGLEFKLPDPPAAPEVSPSLAATSETPASENTATN